MVNYLKTYPKMIALLQTLTEWDVIYSNIYYYLYEINT